MARTIEQIQQVIFDNIAANPNLSGLTSISKVAIWRLMVYAVAFCTWTLETLFDTHSDEINLNIAEQKKGVLTWYKTMALQFQYGFALVPGYDYFDNGTTSADEIEASKIVKYAAVTEPEGQVLVKIATETDGKLSPIPNEVLESFIAYMKRIRWAGVDVVVINYLPDLLYLILQIKRDPLVIDANGMSILNANYPVNEALQDFMKELPFDGELRLSALVDKLQKVPGVIDATLLSAESSWIDAQTAGYGIPQPIYIAKIPISGYFEIANFENIEYVV
jgi:hypothetical protein